MFLYFITMYTALCSASLGYANPLNARYGQERSGASSRSGSSVVRLPVGTVVGTTTTLSGTQTLVGTVIGTATSLPGTSTVRKFLGVPFAVSPPQRFSPPEALSQDASRVINATQLPPSCPQQFPGSALQQEFTISVFASPPPPSESEDCLYLNIFTPSTPAPPEGWPVMFWIYGGNLQFGYSGLPTYDGSTFAAEQGVVVVTTNYRTNVFGFPNSPQLANNSQNLGFLDQRLALSWVQENIAPFGGDPGKVTIFGESAGGYSVKQLVVVPPNPLPFRAAILESEAASFSNGTGSWNALISALNCSGTDPLACARAAPVATIQQILDNQSLSFGPVVDNVTQSGNVAAAIQSGTAADIPILIGTNANEGSIFALEDSSLDEFINTTFAGAPTSFTDAVVAQYPRTQFPTDTDIIAAIITDLTFQCAAAQIANLTAARGLPVFRYFFNGSFPNTQPIPNAGAFHSSEIPEVFGTFNRIGATTQQGLLSQYMNQAWADFAKDPTLPPQPNWPRLGSTTNDVLTLQADGVSGGPAVSQASLDFRCPVLAPVYLVTGL